MFSFNRGDPSIEQGDDFAQMFGLGAFKDDGDLGHQFAAAVRGGGVGEGAFFGQLAADADAAEILFKISGRPGGEDFGVAADDARGRRVGAVVEAGRLFDGVDEQIIGVNAEPGGQFVERAGVGLGRAAEEAADRSLVELGGGDDFQ